MHLDKFQAEQIIGEANIDSQLMQSILKSICIKNMISQAQGIKARAERDKKNYDPLCDKWYLHRIQLMDRITIRLSASYKLQMERISLLSRTEKYKP